MKINGNIIISIEPTCLSKSTDTSFQKEEEQKKEPTDTLKLASTCKPHI
jgi:hypothetical protein